MSDAVLVAIVSAIPSALAAYLSWRNKRRINELHVQINSRMDQWLETAKSLSRAEGVREGEAKRDAP